MPDGSYLASRIVSMNFPANSSSDLRVYLPYQASSWGSYAVVASIVSDTGSTAPDFEKLSVISFGYDESSFLLRTWNTGGAAKSYRVALIMFSQ